jgi:hypothetical protein
VSYSSFTATSLASGNGNMGHWPEALRPSPILFINDFANAAHLISAQ